MKITALSAQLKNPDRINIFIDGKFRFGLDISQVVDLGLKVGLEVSADRIAELEQEAEFGRVYAQALNYCLLGPRSERETYQYLCRKTLATKYKTKKGDIKTRPGINPEVVEQVLMKLRQKHYLDDYKFAEWWLANRRLKQGASARRLHQELAQKGIERDMIDQLLAESGRDDASELQKIITKKAHRYPDRDKLMRYLVSQGFGYDDIKQALDNHQL